MILKNGVYFDTGGLSENAIGASFLGNGVYFDTGGLSENAIGASFLGNGISFLASGYPARAIGVAFFDETFSGFSCHCTTPNLAFKNLIITRLLIMAAGYLTTISKEIYMITDNAVSGHTPEMRIEHLTKVQNNFPTHSAALNVASDVATWAATCKTAYQNLIDAVDGEVYDQQGATVDVVQKVDFMSDEYGIIKDYAIANITNKAVIKRYGFVGEFPEARLAKLRRVKVVMTEHPKMVAAGITGLLESDQITRLQTAYTAALAANEAQDEEAGDRKTAQIMLDERFEADSVMLRRLYTRAVEKFGPNGIELIDLGFVREVDLGQPGGGNPPDATTITGYANGELTAAEVEDATSYEWQESADTNTWPADWINLSTPTWTVGLPTTANRYFRVRTRNVHGVSAVSPVFVVPAGAGFGAPTGLAHNFATGLTSWDAVAPAAPGEEVQYELHFRPTGSPTSNQIGITTDTFYANWPISGGTLMVRAMSGGQTSGWAELDV